jgi:hypothetical protein
MEKIKIPEDRLEKPKTPENQVLEFRPKKDKK